MKAAVMLCLAVLLAASSVAAAEEVASCPSIAETASSPWVAPQAVAAAATPKWDWALCDWCFEELYYCVCECGGNSPQCPWNPGPGDRECVAECQSWFRACRQNCII